MNAPDPGTARQTTAAGAVGLVALFATVCTIFISVVTGLDWLSGKPDVRTDLQLLAVAACAVLALVALARFLGAREKSAPNVDAPSSGRHVWVAIISLASGLFIIATGVWRLSSATHALTSEDFMFLPTGLIFAFAGVLLALPPERRGLQHVFAALLMTAFASTFDWIAFGPGERHFTMSFASGLGSVFGLQSSEWLGRALFGVPAVIATLVAAMLWVRRSL